MRTVTFSDDKAAKLVNDNFVATWVNRNPKFHNCNQDQALHILENSFECFATKNFCTFFVTPDEEVLHYFSGYYSPAFFKEEVEFVKKLSKEVLDENACLRKDRFANYRDLHRAHQEEHKKATESLKKLRPPQPGSEGYAEFKKNQAEWRARLENLREGQDYLGKVHEALMKATVKQGKTPQLKDVIRNYMGGNEFTEE